MTSTFIILAIARAILLALQLHDRWRRYQRLKRISDRQKKDDRPESN